MKRIGVLLDSTNCDSCLADVIESLAANPQVELYLIVNRAAAGAERGDTPPAAKPWHQRLSRTARAFALRVLAGIELRVLARVSARAARFLSRRDVGGSGSIKTLSISPIFSKSKLVVWYSDEDIERLGAHEFDLLIRGNNSGILRGGILRVAADGVLSFHHGDNRWNRGVPPGFWEVYRRTPSTGFIIQTLTEELDGGKVLFRGAFPTQPSYAQNLVHLCTESNVHFMSLLADYVRTGRLPPAERSLPHGEPLLFAPSVFQILSYTARAVGRFGKLALMKLTRRTIRWQVAFIPRNWPEANLRKGVVVRNPPGRFLADPFVVERDGRTVCFVEDYEVSRHKAGISAVEIREDGSHDHLGFVLREPFHMSFPFLFEFEGDLYMAPEIFESRSIRIYRCEEFPLVWSHVATPFPDVSAGDPMIFQQGPRWWLLANVVPAGALDPTSRLYAFYADQPLSSDWTPHRSNPIVFDSLTARNGGLLVGEDGQHFRVSQRQDFATYGAGINIAAITHLDTEAYEEKMVHAIRPNFFPGIAMCHHMHSNGRFTVYDFAKWDGWK